MFLEFTNSNVMFKYSNARGFMDIMIVSLKFSTVKGLMY